MRAASLWRASGSPSKSMIPETVRRDQELPEVVVAVGPDDLGGGRQRVDHGQGLDDPRRQLGGAWSAPRPTSTSSADSRSFVRRGPMIGSRPGSPRAAPSRAGRGPSAAAACRPAVSVPRSAAMSVACSTLTSPGARSQPTSVSASDSKASAPSATNSWAIATVEVPSRADTTSAKPASARDSQKAGLFAQERGHLQIRVQPGLDAPVRLEQQPLAEHDRRVRLVRAEIPFRAGRSRGPTRHDAANAMPGGRRGRPSAPDACRGPRRARRCVLVGRGRQGRDDAPLPHRHAKRPPGAIARSRLRATACR